MGVWLPRLTLMTVQRCCIVEKNVSGFQTVEGSRAFLNTSFDHDNDDDGGGDGDGVDDDGGGGDGSADDDD